MMNKMSGGKMNMKEKSIFKELQAKFLWELSCFKEEILKMSKEQVFNQSYKIMAMHYIHDQLIEYSYNLSTLEASHLLFQKDILERIYEAWMNEVHEEKEDLNVCIKKFVDMIGKEELYGEVSMYKKSIA